MADVIFSTSKDYTNYLKSEMHGRLRTNNSFNDSTINFIGDIIGQTVDQNKKELSQIYSSSLLSRATGMELETLVYNLFGITRKPSSYASSFKEEKNVLFYVSGSQNVTFGDINDGNNILIPKGTLLGSSSSFDSPDNAVYSVLSNTLLLATSSIQYVDVVAVSPGSNSLVSQNTLIYHDFLNYTNANLNYLKVTNRFPIINASNVESDDDLRSRAVHFIDSQRQGSLDNINSFALNVPGILNTVVIPGYYGIGTTAIVCKGVDQESSIRLVSDVQKSLNTLSLPGGSFYAIPPVYINLNLTLILAVSSSLPNAEIEVLKSLIKSEIFKFCRNNTSTIVNLLVLSLGLSERIKVRSRGLANLRLNDNNSVFFEMSISKTILNLEPSVQETVSGLQLLLKQEEVLNIGNIQINEVQL